MTGLRAAVPEQQNAGGSARPAVEVRTEVGKLIERLTPAGAHQVVNCGWGEWIGTGRLPLCAADRLRSYIDASPWWRRVPTILDRWKRMAHARHISMVSSWEEAKCRAFANSSC
jgi:hypothetical protein